MKMSRTGLWRPLAVMMIASQSAHAQTPVPPSPKDFVMAAVQSDQYEILAGNVAVAQSHDPRVLKFAQDMIHDHSRLSDDWRHAAMASGLEAPDQGVSSEQASLLGGLQSAPAKDFDKTYARQQELEHTQAVAVVESFATAGLDPHLRMLAESALPTLRDHLIMAQQLMIEIDGQ